MPRIPGIPGPGDLPKGGVLLGGPQAPQRSITHVHFHSCQLGADFKLLQSGAVKEVELVVLDPGWSTLYHLAFPDLETLKGGMAEIIKHLEEGIVTAQRALESDNGPAS